MAKRQSLQDRVAEGYEPFMDDLADRIAALQRPIADNVHVKPEERQRRWWQTEKGWTPEREYTLLTGMNPDGTPALNPQTGQPQTPLTPQDVALIKYPMREIDAKVFGGYDDDMGQYTYALKMAELGPPAPDPLEQAAREIEAKREAEKPAPQPAPDLFKGLELPPVPTGAAPEPPMPPAPLAPVVPEMGGS